MELEPVLHQALLQQQLIMLMQPIMGVQQEAEQLLLQQSIRHQLQQSRIQLKQFVREVLLQL